VKKRRPPRLFMVEHTGPLDPPGVRDLAGWIGAQLVAAGVRRPEVIVLPEGVRITEVAVHPTGPEAAPTGAALDPRILGRLAAEVARRVLRELEVRSAALDDREKEAPPDAAAAA